MTAHFHPSLIRQAPTLCQLVGTYRGTLPDGDWFIQAKIDGWRCLSFVGRDGQKRLWTRNGIPIEGTGHIRHKLALMERIAGEPMVFDGELQVGETLAATKAWCERDWKGGGEAGTMLIFDCLTQSEWEQGGTDRPLHERLAMLDRLYREMLALPANWEWREGTRGKEPPAPHIMPLSYEYAASHADVMDFATRVWSRGGEGAVVKRADSGYVRDRSNEWMKIKKAGVR